MTTERDEVVGVLRQQLRASNREAVRIELGKIVEAATRASKLSVCESLAHYVRSKMNSHATNMDDSPLSLMRVIVERLHALGLRPDRNSRGDETIRPIEMIQAEKLLELDQHEAVALVLAIYLAAGGDPRAAAARAQGYDDSVQYTHVLCAAKDDCDIWEAIDPMQSINKSEPFRPGTSSFGTWVPLQDMPNGS